MNNQQCTTYFPSRFVLMPGCLTFLSSISPWCKQDFCSPIFVLLTFSLFRFFRGKTTLYHHVPPNYPVILCWCHYMELFYLLYLNGFIRVLLSCQSPTLDSYGAKSTLYRPFHLSLCGYTYRPQKASGQIWIKNLFLSSFKYRFVKRKIDSSKHYIGHSITGLIWWTINSAQPISPPVLCWCQDV